MTDIRTMRVDVGDVRLRTVDQGPVDSIPIVAIHGNLGCHHWYDPVRAELPDTCRFIAYDWRGCGDSDKPEPTEAFANYSMETHARDLVRLLDALGVDRCHLICHSASGLIVCEALRLAPERFEKCLWLDAIGPDGLDLTETMGFLEAMKASPDVAFAGFATAAPSLFQPESLAPGQVPVFADSASKVQRDAFAAVVEATRDLSDGIWLGTAHHMLAATRQDTGLKQVMASSEQVHLVVWGARDVWVSWESVRATAALMPTCTVRVVEHVGHGMNLEDPVEFAAIMADFFGTS